MSQKEGYKESKESPPTTPPSLIPKPPSRPLPPLPNITIPHATSAGKPSSTPPSTPPLPQISPLSHSIFSAVPQKRSPLEPKMSITLISEDGKKLREIPSAIASPILLLANGLIHEQEQPVEAKIDPAKLKLSLSNSAKAIQATVDFIAETYGGAIDHDKPLWQKGLTARVKMLNTQTWPNTGTRYVSKSLLTLTIDFFLRLEAREWNRKSHNKIPSTEGEFPTRAAFDLIVKHTTDIEPLERAHLTLINYQQLLNEYVHNINKTQEKRERSDFAGRNNDRHEKAEIFAIQEKVHEMLKQIQKQMHTIDPSLIDPKTGKTKLFDFESAWPWTPPTKK